MTKQEMFLESLNLKRSQLKSAYQRFKEYQGERDFLQFRLDMELDSLKVAKDTWLSKQGLVLDPVKHVAYTFVVGGRNIHDSIDSWYIITPGTGYTSTGDIISNVNNYLSAVKDNAKAYFDAGNIWGGFYALSNYFAQVQASQEDYDKYGSFENLILAVKEESKNIISYFEEYITKIWDLNTKIYNVDNLLYDAENSFNTTKEALRVWLDEKAMDPSLQVPTIDQVLSDIENEKPDTIVEEGIVKEVVPETQTLVTEGKKKSLLIPALIAGAAAWFLTQ